MLIFKVIRKVNYPRCLKCKHLRFLSLQETAEQHVKTSPRKYVKPSSTQKLLPWRGSNLNNLFAGIIDKKIFEYPSVLSVNLIDTVINHSALVEEFFSLNAKSELTNDIFKKLKELELFGLSVPQKLGGAGYSETETKYLLECTSYNPIISRFLGYKEDFGCRLLNIYGSEEQKQKYLPALAEGKVFMTMAYLENGPLINLTALEGNVFLNVESNEYILHAEKKWVHYADKADVFLVLVKLPTTSSDETEIRLNFKFFIVDKNMPGVTVRKIESQCAEESGLYDVYFKGVAVPSDNILGSPDNDGYDILKTGISHSNLTDATLCLGLMKQMFHAVLVFVEEKNIKNVQERGHLYVKENIVTLLSYIYALESVVYLLTSNLDMYERHDAFNDTVMAKTLGLNCLRVAIQLYTEILGCESFKRSGLLEEALKALHYHSVFEENIEYLKMMSAADGLISASLGLAERIKILRTPYENPYDCFKLRAITSFRKKGFEKKLNLKMELHSSLSVSVDTLEKNLVLFNKVVENLFYEKGSLSIYCEHAVNKMTEIASYLFATIACLSRASSSVTYDVNNCRSESLAAQGFTAICDAKIKKLCDEEFRYPELLEYYRIIGKTVFTSKEYQLEHPLSRGF